MVFKLIKDYESKGIRKGCPNFNMSMKSNSIDIYGLACRWRRHKLGIGL